MDDDVILNELMELVGEAEETLPPPQTEALFCK